MLVQESDQPTFRHKTVLSLDTAKAEFAMDVFAIDNKTELSQRIKNRLGQGAQMKR